MAAEEVHIEGSPSMAAALGVAAVGVVFFGAVTLVILLVPFPIKSHHVILGGVTGAFAAIMVPWQLMDAKSRRHRLTERSLIYSFGILSHTEVEIPFTSIQAVTVRQGLLQRIFGCGDVRVSAHGVSAGKVFVASSADLSAITVKSIPDFREVSDFLRERL